jgi:hypothetical protein
LEREEREDSNRPEKESTKTEKRKRFYKIEKQRALIII